MENIFLYSDKGIETFNENYSLSGQLEAIQNCVPIINIYYIPSDIEQADNIRNSVIEETSQKFGEQLSNRMRELFGEVV